MAVSTVRGSVNLPPLFVTGPTSDVLLIDVSLILFNGSSVSKSGNSLTSLRLKRVISDNK